MKSLLSVCLIVISSFLFAGTAVANTAASENVLSGVVLEVKDVPDFTYLRLKTDDGEVWAAVMSASVKVGATVQLQNPVVMKNFTSKAMNKTFPMIVFGSLLGERKTMSNGMSKPEAAANPHAGGSPASSKTAELGKGERITKASGANAYTVAEINTKTATLKDKTVVVRGKVVKYNGGIMDKNWIHLRDGSGSAKDGSDDILVTTSNPAQAGDVITVKGVVHTDKNFGSGYSYKVLIEDAILQ